MLNRFLGLVLLSCSFSAFAQTNNRLVLYAINEQNGLSDNRTTCFLQDKSGFMWIGTQDGLNRFDGATVTKYKGKGDSLTLPNNHITDIVEDDSNTIWVTTHGGLCRFNAEKNTFTTFQTSSTKGNASLMWSLLYDKKGSLWIASEVGLIEFRIRDEKFITYYNETLTEERAQLGSNWIKKIAVSSTGQLWLATHYGLWKFFPDSKKFESVIVRPNRNFDDLINTIIVDHRDKLWICHWGEGIKHYDPITHSLQQVKKVGLNTNIFGLIEVKNKNGKYSIWASGLIEIDEQIEVKNYLPPINDSERNYLASDFYLSKDGLLWITNATGAKIMDPNRQFFTNHFLAKNDLSSQSISFLETNHQLWIGGSGNEFLKVYDSGFYLQKSMLPSKELLAGLKENPAILDMAKEDQNHLWLCTENGMVLLDETNGKQKVFRLTEKEIKTPARNFFAKIFIDSKGTHWVFPWRSGIWQLDPRSGQFKKIIISLSDTKTARRLVVSSATEDKNGNVWFADLDHGLLFYDRLKNTFSQPTSSIFGQYKLDEVFYQDDFIWLVAQGAVARIDVNSMKIEQWPIPEEFNKAIYDFCFDKQNHIWMATSSGLLSFNINSYSFSRYSTGDGLINNHMDGRMICLQNGKVLFGMENYITEFNPVKLSKQSERQPVIITSLSSNDKIVEIVRTSKQEKHADLDYSFTNFKFSWSLLNFSNPFQNQYYCKLEGVDKEWKNVGKVGQTEYASLLPGTYTFRARGFSSDGVQSLNDDYLILVIHPPFWKTWWFLLLCFAIVSAAAYLIYQYRVNQLLLRERLRTKISIDLHDDIGSTLSSISILGDLAYRQLPDHPTGSMVMEIRDTAQLLMEKMDDIVWGINPSNDSLNKLLLRLQKFTAQMLEAKNIEYTFDVEPNIQHLRLSMEYRQHIYLILKESINNLVKHSKCNKASIAIHYLNGELVAIVEDNGVGFDSASVQEGNGFGSLKRRTKEMKGNIEIKSGRQTGTQISLRVKIK